MSVSNHRISVGYFVIGDSLEGFLAWYRCSSRSRVWSRNASSHLTATKLLLNTSYHLKRESVCVSVCAPVCVHLCVCVCVCVCVCMCSGPDSAVKALCSCSCTVYQCGMNTAAPWLWLVITNLTKSLSCSLQSLVSLWQQSASRPIHTHLLLPALLSRLFPLRHVWILAVTELTPSETIPFGSPVQHRPTGLKVLLPKPSLYRQSSLCY